MSYCFKALHHISVTALFSIHIGSVITEVVMPMLIPDMLFKCYNVSSTDTSPKKDWERIELVGSGAS